MRTDNNGNSWPSSALEPIFDEALRKVMKDGRVRYIFHDGSVSLRATKAEKLSRNYWILGQEEYIHATEPWLKIKNPKF